MYVIFFVGVYQFTSVSQSCPTLQPHGLQHTRLLWLHHQLPEFTQALVHRVGDAIQLTRCPLTSCLQSSPAPSSCLILCPPLLLLPPIPPSIRVFSSESVVAIRWPKYWSFSICPSNEHSRLNSFRKSVTWLDFLAVQRTLKSLLQHQSSKATILWRSAFFMFQLLNPYMNTGKTIALTRKTFGGKEISLLFNMLLKFITAFLLRSKCLLISWLQSLSVVILEP